ncbi:mechanosensitive ion channel family protein [Candidatus Saccharibacteria bacterium]|nr:mechanosensitive ion channel family protein [Candidatus Saccharibacteria bacterium]
MLEDIATSLAQIIVSIGESVGTWLDQHLVNVIVIIIMAVVARRLLTIVTVKLLSKTIRPDMYPTTTDRKKRLDTLNSLMTAVVKVTVWVIAIMMIISEVGVNTAPLLASAGIIGVALGFGAQSLVKDFVSGIFIILENQYRVGDVVSIAGVDGAVEAVTIRTTVLRSFDGNVHHIPNGTIDLTTNKTQDYAGINLRMAVAYDTDIERLEHIINHVGEEMASDPDFQKMIKEKPTFLRISDFLDSSVEVLISGTVVAGNQWDVKGELRKRLKKAFDKNGIEIPFPQVVVNKPKKK